MSHEKIIDQIGSIAEEIKALQAARKDLITELDGLKPGKFPGFRFVATIVEKVDWRLDTKAVKAELGEDWYNARCKQVISRAVRTAAI
jgi:hypothetical protein